MKKINQVHIHNFQSHEDTVISMAGFLTTIVGPSDAGKSAVIRALRWAFFNEPAGTQYMRVGTNDTFVRVSYVDGSSLLRARTKTTNYYVIEQSDGSTERFEGFGQGVPDQVTEFTQMRKVQITDKDAISINLSEQLENAFLLGEKASLRAEAIGRLAGTHTIGQAHKIAGQDKFNANRDISRLKVKEAELDLQLEQFNDLEEEENQLESLEKIATTVDQKQESLLPLKTIHEQLKTNKHMQQTYKDVLVKYKNMNQLTKMKETIESKASHLTLLDGLKQRYAQNRLETSSFEKMHLKLSHFTNFVADSAIIEKENQREKLADLRTSNHTINDQIKLLEKFKQFDGKRAKEVSTQLESDFSKYQNFMKWKHQLEDNKRRLAIGHDYINNLKGCELAHEKAQKIDANLLKLKQIVDIKKEAERLAGAYTDAQNTLRASQTSLSNLTQAYLEIFETQGICPYCQSDLDSNALEHLKQHMEGDDRELRTRN